MNVRKIEQAEVLRNRWGQPIINGTTYQRASSMAGKLDDKSGLVRWSREEGIAQVLRRPELLDLGDPKEIARATEQAGASARGTDVHAVIQRILETGEIPEGYPDDVVVDAVAGIRCLEDLELEPLACEVFVVNEELGTAGTLDVLLRDTDGQCIVGDWKTITKAGSWKFRSLSFAIQLASYASAKPINADGEIVDWAEVGLEPPILDEGLVVAITAGKGQTTALAVDLATGRDLAELASLVTDARLTATLKVIA